MATPRSGLSVNALPMTTPIVMLKQAQAKPAAAWSWICEEEHHSNKNMSIPQIGGMAGPERE